MGHQGASCGYERPCRSPKKVYWKGAAGRNTVVRPCFAKASELRRDLSAPNQGDAEWSALVGHRQRSTKGAHRKSLPGKFELGEACNEAIELRKHAPSCRKEALSTDYEAPLEKKRGEPRGRE